MRKLISLVLSVMMLLTLLPVTALAEDGERTESDEDVSLTVEGQTVRFYTGMAGGYLEYNADGLAEAGTIDEGNIPAFFVRNADFTGNIFLAVKKSDGSEPAVAVWGDCDWITVTEEHPNEVTAAQFAVYKAEISESRGDNNTAYLTLDSSTFAIVFENSGDGGSGGTFDISELEGAALTYAQTYLVESNGHLKRSDEDATGIELGQDSYSDDEIGTIKTAIHAIRKLDYTVRDPLMWLRLPNDDMELGEYLTRLAVVAGISLWSDDADIGEDAALFRSVNGHDIRFCSCVDYGVPSLEHWSGSYVSEDESDAAFHTSWDMTHFVLIFNCTADNPLTSLTVKDAEVTESENQYTVTDEEDTLTVSIEDYGSDEFDGEVRHNFGIEKTELLRAHTLTFVATYKDDTTAEFSVVFEERNSGSDWGSNILTADELDSKTLVITGVQDISDRENVELDVDWREWGGRIQNIGLPADVLEQLAAMNKQVFVANWHGVQLFLPTGVVKGMAKKVSSDDMLWIVTDYRSDDGGSANCFRIRLSIGETVDTAQPYALPEGQSYTFGIDVVQSSDTYEVCCPKADDATVLERQTAAVETMNYEDSDMMRLTFAADHDGIFLLQPVGYTQQISWPWYGLVPWTPTAGTTPTAPSDYLKVLYDAGYTFPTIGADFHLTFPPELKEWTEDCGDDWDYRVEINADTGRIDVIMNYGDPARWEAAARSALNDSFMADGIFYRYYFGVFDGERPLTYGMDGFRQTSSTEAIENWLEMGLYDSYYPNNGRHMATLNRQDASSTMMIIDKADAWEVIAIAMDEADGKTAANASVRYALELHVTATATVREKLAAVGGTVIQNASRIIVNPDATWTSEFTADGTLFMRSPNFDYENRYGEQVGELTVTAPAGYTLQEWTTFGSSYRDSDTQFPVRLRNLFDQRIDLTWVNETTGERLQEQVLVEYGYDKAWMDLLASDLTDTSAVYKPATIMDGKTKAKLADNGISVTYYPDTGYFVTSVDATKVTDISVLEEGVELPVPDNLQETAKYCKIGGFGGSENPNTHGQLRAEAVRESFRYELEAESIEDGVAKLPFINLACIDVAGTGLQVYYAKSQMYDSCVVQWLAEDDTVLGYSYVYGRNGDFVTAVQTNVVSAVTEAVEAPTLVNGESDVTFTCDRLPQSGGGDSKSIYLQLDVEGASGEQVVYLPYSYLDMTAEEGLALAKQGEHPTIYHYLDDGCTDYEKIAGEYTEYGVKFTTTGFSPFVLDCSLWGDLNGSGRMEITDMQALYEHLTGIKELARTGACDLNNDGEVDVYDLQSLYERVSRQGEGISSAVTG